MPVTRRGLNAGSLLAFALLCACDLPQARYATAQQNDERIAAMYVMRSIGVELVTMFETKNLAPARVRELTRQLKSQSEALPRHFAYAPDPQHRQATATKASIWNKPEDFQKAMTTFQHKSRNLAAIVDATPDAELDRIWPVLVDTGNSCTACHQQFRIGGDPSHD